MNAQLKKEWVHALRSGKYKQTLKQLRAKDDDGEWRYCCLGVLCDLVDPGGWDGPSFYGSSSSAPYGVLDDVAQNIFMGLNDEHGLDFGAIASVVEGLVTVES